MSSRLGRARWLEVRPSSYYSIQLPAYVRNYDIDDIATGPRVNARSSRQQPGPTDDHLNNETHGMRTRQRRVIIWIDSRYLRAQCYVEGGKEYTCTHVKIKERKSTSSFPQKVYDVSKALAVVNV